MKWAETGTLYHRGTQLNWAPIPNWEQTSETSGGQFDDVRYNSEATSGGDSEEDEPGTMKTAGEDRREEASLVSIF